MLPLSLKQPDKRILLFLPNFINKLFWDADYIHVFEELLRRQGWCVWFSQQEDTKYDDLYIQMSPFW